MTSHNIAFVASLWLFGAPAAYYLAVGLRGILSKKPFVIPSRQTVLVVLLAIAPLFAWSVLTFPAPGRGDEIWSMVPWFLGTWLVIVFAYLLFAARGYTVFAATDSSFRQALLSSLKKLQVPHEESANTVKLTSPSADLLLVSGQGVCTFTTKKREHVGLLKDIGGAMNEYYGSSAVSTNLRQCIIMAGAGAVCLVVLAALLLLMLGVIVISA